MTLFFRAKHENENITELIKAKNQTILNTIWEGLYLFSGHLVKESKMQPIKKEF